MQLRNKSYPYPVLSQENGSYTHSAFESSCTQEIDGRKININITVDLENEQLEERLKDNSVVIAHHIECPTTRYRSIKRTKETKTDVFLLEKEVEREVQICTFLVANEGIEKYTNNNFADEYKGFKFDLEKGCIMGVANQINIEIEKSRDELTNTSSIFSIVPALDEGQTEQSVDLSQQKIVIKLPQKAYRVYAGAQSNMSIQPVMHSMIIVPALLYTFFSLKKDRDSLYLYENYRWYRALKKATRQTGYTIDEEKLEDLDAYKLSQALINSPITGSMSLLLAGGKTDEG